MKKYIRTVIQLLESLYNVLIQITPMMCLSYPQTRDPVSMTSANPVWTLTLISQLLSDTNKATHNSKFVTPCLTAADLVVLALSITPNMKNSACGFRCDVICLWLRYWYLLVYVGWWECWNEKTFLLSSDAPPLELNKARRISSSVIYILPYIVILSCGVRWPNLYLMSNTYLYIYIYYGVSWLRILPILKYIINVHVGKNLCAYSWFTMLSQASFVMTMIFVLI